MNCVNATSTVAREEYLRHCANQAGSGYEHVGLCTPLVALKFEQVSIVHPIFPAHSIYSPVIYS